MRRLSIQPSWHNSDEHKACSLAGCECRVSETLQPNSIGIGSVDYCRSSTQWPACDPYPDWLPWGRRIHKGIAAPTQPLFYKPADIPKRFKSEVMEVPPSGKWVASDPVDFVVEWRAYVVLGKVLGVFCYSDFDNDNPQEFPWSVPGEITAAIDFGLTPNAGILPVEVNDPYAIGWYGRLSQYQMYADFVIAGWEHMIARHGS